MIEYTKKRRGITMFQRHTGNGWLATGIIFYAIIYALTIRKQENKLKYSLLFWYIAALIDLTLFPIPYNAIAFDHIQTAHSFRLSLSLFENTSKLQNLLNTVMFIPLGVLLSVNFTKLKPWHIITLIGLTTLAIELIQLITSYLSLNTRIFDVDDLLFNFLGGFITYVIYLAVKKNCQKKLKLHD